MKTLSIWLKFKIKNFLLYLIRKLDVSIPDTPKIRLSNNNIFKKEINIPTKVTVVVSFLALFFMLSMQVANGSFSKILAIFLLLVLLYVCVVLYLKPETKKLKLDNNKVMIISFISVISLLFFQIYTSELAQTSFPLAAFTVIVALLVSVRVSLVYSFVMSIFLFLVNDFYAIVPLIQLTAGIISIINIKKIRSRAQFIRVGINIFFAMLIVLVCFYLFGVTTIEYLQENIAYLAINSTFSVLMILALLPIFEYLFSRTTNIKLIELADFNNPILKQLMEEAPGTYHHSLMTASLAEQAAEAIGENSLLARVCSYYHDIGKLNNPEYFIENQFENYNPHDELSPSMSGLVLVAHVKDGVALAKKYKINQVIIDAINQHHGTSLIQYFYNKAIENNENVNEQDFRYPGQKPTTKIAAILMIADSVEAIARTVKDKSAGKMQEIVEKVINNRFADGQFSDCPITLKDLFQISESMVTTLCGMHHARIEYKTVEKK